MTRVLAISLFLVVLAANASTSEAIMLLAVAALVAFVVGGLLVLGDVLRGGGR